MLTDSQRHKYSELWGFIVSTFLSIMGLLIATVSLLSNNLTSNNADSVIYSISNALVTNLGESLGFFMGVGFSEWYSLISLSIVLSVIAGVVRYPFVVKDMLFSIVTSTIIFLRIILLYTVDRIRNLLKYLLKK